MNLYLVLNLSEKHFCNISWYLTIIWEAQMSVGIFFPEEHGTRGATLMTVQRRHLEHSLTTQSELDLD